MDADGSNRRQVTKKTDNIGLREFYPSFSPNGKKLVFARATNWTFMNNVAQPKIYTIDIDGSNERCLTDGYYAKWSPDGKKIVFYNEGKIFIMDTDGKNQVKIADGYMPSWSLDGKHIAFSNYLAVSDIEIFKMDSDGNNVVRLTKGMKGAIEASWSPDGKYIVFSNQIFDGVCSFCSIYKVSANGGDSVLISEDYSSGPSWFDPSFAIKYAVDPSDKSAVTWGWIKNR
jgi:TolB protein